jgi:hypothetical protein
MIMSNSDCEIVRESRARRGVLRLDHARRLLDQLMVLVPGSASYRPMELPEQLSDWIGIADQDELLSVVEACLAQLVTDGSRYD